METIYKGYRIQYEQWADGWMCRIFRPTGALMLNCPTAAYRIDEDTYLKCVHQRIEEEEEKRARS